MDTAGCSRHAGPCEWRPAGLQQAQSAARARPLEAVGPWGWPPASQRPDKPPKLLSVEPALPSQ